MKNNREKFGRIVCWKKKTNGRDGINLNQQINDIMTVKGENEKTSNHFILLQNEVCYPIKFNIIRATELHNSNWPIGPNKTNEQRAVCVFFID